jgi:hypothetical protein
MELSAERGKPVEPDLADHPGRVDKKGSPGRQPPGTGSPLDRERGGAGARRSRASEAPTLVSAMANPLDLDNNHEG